MRGEDGVATTVVVNRCCGPSASIAAVVVSSFIVEAGVTGPAPLWKATLPSDSCATSTTTCGPSFLDRRSGARTRRTAAPDSARGGVLAATAGAGRAAGKVRPSGGSTLCGSVIGDGGGSLS